VTALNLDTPRGGRSTLPTVVAYGFDRLGFTLPKAPVPSRDGALEWQAYDDTRHLDRADGLIIPQGIFESLEEVHAYNSYTKISCDEPLMLQREKEVSSVIKNGGWVCFLVREIVDEQLHGYDPVNSDLCKRLLNGIRVRRHLLDSPSTVVTAVRDEFKSYIDRYGVARTTFSTQGQVSGLQVLAKVGQHAVGFQVGGCQFFLPFHTTNMTALHDITTLVAEAVAAYRRKTSVTLPGWVNAAFSFSEERALIQRRAALTDELKALETQIEEWTQYKTILVTSGELLRTRLIALLERYFGLKVDPIDGGREDFKILTPDGSGIAAVGECKGINGGVRREHISQADAHRGRQDLTPSTPGFLVVNTQMNIPSFENRQRTGVVPEHVRYARSQNVLVMRAIDLLKLMAQLEGHDAADRGQELLRLLASGGGWLCVEDESALLLADA
jgi:hypothetical protein